jgi:hypothetical protein
VVFSLSHALSRAHRDDAVAREDVHGASVTSKKRGKWRTQSDIVVTADFSENGTTKRTIKPTTAPSGSNGGYNAAYNPVVRNTQAEDAGGYMNFHTDGAQKAAPGVIVVPGGHSAASKPANRSGHAGYNAAYKPAGKSTTSKGAHAADAGGYMNFHTDGAQKSEPGVIVVPGGGRAVQTVPASDAAQSSAVRRRDSGAYGFAAADRTSSVAGRSPSMRIAGAAKHESTDQVRLKAPSSPLPPPSPLPPLPYF